MRASIQAVIGRSAAAVPAAIAALAAVAIAVAIVAGCTVDTGPAASVPLPDPTCRAVKIKIDGALPCERIVEIAIAALQEGAPHQLKRGVAAIDVSLEICPRNEVPPQIDCGDEQFVQFVMVTFDTPPPGGPIERSLTVAVAPVSGRVLGIANPLIR